MLRREDRGATLGLRYLKLRNLVTVSPQLYLFDEPSEVFGKNTNASMKLNPVPAQKVSVNYFPSSAVHVHHHKQLKQYIKSGKTSFQVFTH